MIVVGPVRRNRVNAEAVSALTAVPFARLVTRGDGTPGGLEFDGDLTEAELDAVWWWQTSESDADETRRRALHALLSDEATCECCRQVIGYLLGVEPPEMPPPEPTVVTVARPAIKRTTKS